MAGWRPVVFTTNNTGYAAALDLVRAGIDVQAVIDNGPVVDPPPRGRCTTPACPSFAMRWSSGRSAGARSAVS
ncbi:MAG: hypothetical protein R3D25_01340 [Geminicoccaceae bacterium]